MVKIFTVMYILCSIYTTSPDCIEISAIQDKGREMLSQALYSSSKITMNEAPEVIEDTPLDFLEELKKMNYYKEDSKDAALNKRNAILRFQSDHNLIVNGTWDEKCLETLKKRKKDESFCYPDTISDPASEDKWIVINKTRRVLTLYEGTSVLKKYPVAIGNPPSLTPSGKFKISSKVVNPAWGGGGYAKPVAGGTPQNPLGYRWLGLSLSGGDRYGIHGNNKPYSIGKNVSHGCIRMINSDVKELFEMVDIAASVWIGTEKELEKWGVTQKTYLPENE